MPNLQRMTASGCSGLAQAVVPSYTNPNNVAILTGTTPDVNGICGNYYYDEASGREIMMDDPGHLRAATVPAAFSAEGARVAAVTTKEKLRRFLGHGLRGISFSVERAEAATEAENGIGDVLGLVGRGNPGIYDPEASVFCLEAGARLLQREEVDLMYLSTTDFVQHKFAPGAPEAAVFYGRLDLFLGELHDLGAVVGITADHGMNDKTKADGSPNVQYLGSILEAAGIEARVILPVTDPYVVHHGALGSYATVYLGAADLPRARALLERVPGVERVLAKQEAALEYALPPDLIGDLVLLADRGTVLGKTPDWHDLSDVETGLRSHGGLHEATVPFIVNRPLKSRWRERLEGNRMRNFDLFDVLCNGVEGLISCLMDLPNRGAGSPGLQGPGMEPAGGISGGGCPRHSRDSQPQPAAERPFPG